MSKLSLASFVMFQENKKTGAVTFSPEPKKIVMDNGRPTIAIGDIPLHPGIKAPKNALTVLYGFRDALDEIKKQYDIAKKNDMSLVKAEFRLEVGEIIVGVTSKELLPNTKFLNILRISTDLKMEIIDGVNELVAKENKSSDFYDKIQDVGARPDLLCQFLRDSEAFRHIIAVVYPIPDGTRKGRQVATIFSTDVEEIVFRGDHSFGISVSEQAMQISEPEELKMA